MAEKRHVQHLRSRVVEQNGQPKLPLASDLQYGELAINYHKGTETVSLKNDGDEIVLFHDEVEISSGQPKVNTEIWIDTGDKSVTEVYTKQQIDSQVSSINDDIASVKSKNTEQDSRIKTLEENAYEVQIGTSADTISANTKVFIDTEMDNTVEVYTKQQIDSQVSGINSDIASVKDKNTEQDSRIQALEEKTEEMTGDTISKVRQAISELSGTVDTKVSQLEEKDEELRELAGNAYEVQIGTSADTISANTKVFIDTEMDNTVEVYTKQQIDSQVSGINSDIASVKDKNTEQDSRIKTLEENAYEVQIGTSADTISANTKVFIDTEMDNTVEIYTKQQVDSQVSGINSDIASVMSLAKDNIIISDTTPSSNNTELFVDTSNDGGLYEIYTKAQVDVLIAGLQSQIDELKP